MKHENRIRFSITYCIVKLLSCKSNILGYREYSCTNPNCSHSKRIFHTCKCKACSSCGKKATATWIKKQYNILPNTNWQHVTLTMPSELWDFFWLNRWLIGKISKLGADCFLSISYKQNVIPGIFAAIHTFGRDLKRNIHLHLSITLGGIMLATGQWKSLYFNKSTIEKQWKYKIISLFRTAYQNQQLKIPNSIKNQLNNAFTFEQFLDGLYRKKWIIDLAKSTPTPKLTIDYLGSYFKRPVIAEAKLKHYDGQSVTFKYLDRRYKLYTTKTFSVEVFIAKFVQHIPDVNFRMIRYYGFLSNRLRGKLLPAVYQALKQIISKQSTATSFVDLMKQSFKVDPLQCILCGCQLALTAIIFGKTKTKGLLNFHKELALLHII